MAFWNISYRDAEGRLDTLSLEAPSKAAVFAELEKRGVRAVRIDETARPSRPAKKKPRAASASARRPASGRRIAIAILAALAAAVAATVAAIFAMRSGGGAESAPRSGRRAIADAAPKLAAPPAREAKSARQIAEELAEQAREFVKKAPTNEIHWIIPPLDPDDPDNALRTRVCQELGSLLSVEPGEQMPPFPYSFLLEDELRDAKERGEETGEIDNGNKAFLDSLAKFKIAAKETDDESRLAHKERIVAAQSELLESMDEGLSVNDTIRAAYEFRKRAYEVRTELARALRELAAGGEYDMETMREQLERANETLGKDGIKAISADEVFPEEEDAAGDEAEEEDVR